MKSQGIIGPRNRLRLPDVRRVIRLLYQTKDLDRTTLWPAKLLRRLCHLTNATTGAAVFYPLPFQDTEVPTSHGLSPADARLILSLPEETLPSGRDITTGEPGKDK